MDSTDNRDQQQTSRHALRTVPAFLGLASLLLVLAWAYPFGSARLGGLRATSPVATTRASRTATLPGAHFVPLHERPGYNIEPPDILHISVTQYGLPVDDLPTEYLTSPDGILNLGRFGFLHVAGSTLENVQALIADRCDQLLSGCEVRVAVSGANSHVFYIIEQGSGAGDRVIRLPANGDDTVLAALTQLKPAGLANKKIWIARPRAGAADDQVLRVDAERIIAGSDLSTNHDILSGDRLFVVETPSIWNFFR